MNGRKHWESVREITEDKKNNIKTLEVLIFKHRMPKSLVNGDNQILLDKHEVEDLEHLRMDILANRDLVNY